MFEVEHINGKTNLIADYLSRSPIDDDEQFVNHISVEYINLLESITDYNVSIDVLSNNRRFST